MRSAAGILVHHELAVYDYAACGFEYAAGHRHAFVIGTHFERLHPLRVGQSIGACVVFRLFEVSVPIAALNRDIGDEMMQVRFVHHDNAGIAQGCIIDEIVMGVVAHLIQRDVGRAWIAGGGKDLQIDQRGQVVD
jgi:hypothetical protein